MAVILGAWISFFAAAFVSGHADQLAAGVGAIGANLDAGVSQRVRGDSGHLLVTHARLALTAVLWILAVVEVVRRRRRGHDDIAAIALLAAPLTLVVLQPYGGEIPLRVVLFSLPFVAFFIASLARRVPAVATAAVAVALVPVFLLTYYGNEQMSWFSRAEVAGVDRLYAVAPAGSALVAWTTSLPWESRDYTEHRYRVVTRDPTWAAMVRMPPGSRRQLEGVAAIMASARHDAYLVITRSQKADVDMNGLGTRGSLDRVDAALRRSPAFRLLYANRDASVFALAPARAHP
jgi:hypothetical protein